MPTILRGSDNFDTGTDFYADSDALTLFNAGGSAPVYACRAWVNFNGTGVIAIRDSGNVSSITDTGTGRYTVNLTTSMPDATYVTLATAQDTTETSTRIAQARRNTVSDYFISVDTASSDYVDAEWIGSCVFR
jgi:hypothetical protein